MRKYILPLGVFLILFSAFSIFPQWTQIGPNSGSSNDPAPIINDLAVSGDTIFAANNVFGLHYSTDLGVTWCETGFMRGNNLGIGVSNGIIIMGKDNVIRSTDKGESFTSISSSGGVITLDLKNNIALCGTSGGYRVSTNSGLTWTQPSSSGTYNAVAICGTVCLVGSSAGIFRSTDYAFFPQTLFSRAVNSITVNGNTVYSCSTTGIDISTDQGLTWNTTGMTSNTKSLAVFGTSLYCVSGSTIYKSTNNGQNWINVFNSGTLLKTIKATSIGITAMDNTSMYFSRNDGVSWTQAKFHFMQAYTVFNTPGAFYTSCDSWGVHRTTDNGQNWLNLTNGLDFWSIRSLIKKGALLFAGMNNVGVYSSNDDGFTWNLTSTFNRTVFSMYTDGTTILAGTKDNGIYYSTNDGVSWTQSNLNSMTVYSIYSDGTKLYAGGTGPGYYASTNGGTSWNQIGTSISPIGSFAHINNFVFAGGGAGIFISSNGGATWSQTSFSYPYVNSMAVSGNYLFAGTEKNGFFVSSDYGQTWRNINKNLGTRISVTRMLISGNDLYAATYSTSVVKAPISGLVGISNTISSEIPDGYLLEQNYPNPFNPSTHINYELRNTNYVTLKVFDIKGKEVAELVNQKQNPGKYSVTFDAGKYNLSSGVYFYKLQAGEFSETKRMVLLK